MENTYIELLVYIIGTVIGLYSLFLTIRIYITKRLKNKTNEYIILSKYNDECNKTIKLNEIIINLKEEIYNYNKNNTSNLI
jgi:ribosomal protein L33